MSTVRLRSRDFLTGPYFCRTPDTTYILDEDISFNPNVDNDSFPTDDQCANYQPFILGFFAAIIILASRVKIDLNCHELAQSPLHCYQQRFFALICIGPSPFIPHTGPAHFIHARDYFSVSDVEIHNGRLGRSSHHAILSNDTMGLHIHHLKIYDFEVAAWGINGGGHIHIHDLDVGPSQSFVPLAATYSAARFIHPFMQEILARDPSAEFRGQKGGELLEALDMEMLYALNQVQEEGRTDHPLFNNLPFMKNEGTAYFGTIHGPHGPAVLGQYHGVPTIPNVRIERVKAHGLTTNAKHIVALGVGGVAENNDVSAELKSKAAKGEAARPSSTPNIPPLIAGCPFARAKRPHLACAANSSSACVATHYPRAYQVDAAGAQLGVLDLIAKGSETAPVYVANILADCQLFVAKCAVTIKERGVGTISRETVAWAEGRGTAPWIDVAVDASGGSPPTPQPLCSGTDFMAHVSKPCYGLRIEGVDGLTLIDLDLSDIQQMGKFPSCDLVTTGCQSRSHVDATVNGSTGADAIGIGLASNKGVRVKGVRIADVRAAYGTARGLVMEFDNEVLEMIEVKEVGIESMTVLYPEVQGKVQNAARTDTVAVVAPQKRPTGFIRK